MLSLLEEPLIACKSTRHIVLRDLELTATRSHAVKIEGGQHCLVAGCRISNTGNYGVWIGDGTDHGVQSCDIWNNGDGGVHLAGGDRKSLTPCHHFVHNCHLITRRAGRAATCRRSTCKAARACPTTASTTIPTARSCLGQRPPN